MTEVVVTGTRGIPDIQGGVETHCEELFPRLVSSDLGIVLVRRSCYIAPEKRISEYKGIRIKDIYAPHQKSLEAIIHTFLAILWAKIKKADIVHIHAIGPGIMTPFARIIGLKVVFTNHGPDYDRKKWGRFARFILKKGEKYASKYASEVIVISRVISNMTIEKYGRHNTHLIFNGVATPGYTSDTRYIAELGLQPRKYVFALGRFVGEKGFDLLIKAFSRLSLNDYRLVIAGDSDHETTYSRQLKALALDRNVVLTGFVKGEKLRQLYSHAKLFVLPSYHEGLPISLLEAMEYRLPVIVSDIAANKQVNLPVESYFKSGDEDALYEKMKTILPLDFKSVDYDMSPYDWDKIAIQTRAVYDKITAGKNRFAG